MYVEILVIPLVALEIESIYPKVHGYELDLDDIQAKIGHNQYL
jgi:hypothetical protein